MPANMCLFRWVLILSIQLCNAYPATTVQAQPLREAVRLVPINLVQPLDGALYISGTFGEPRTNHYHAGLDIKTGGKIGLPVKSVDDGYLSRIRINASGYGKAIYIDHPSGLTSVYAHLETFGEPLASMVKNWQYKRESFELDTLLPKDFIQYKKGEIIAFSGNTGSSAGPHLHFELRETISELAINPMRFFDQIRDTQAPLTGKVMLYSFDKSFYESTPQIITPIWKNGQLTADVLTQEGRLCFSVEAFDRQDLTPEHKNGIPILRMYENEKLVFYRKTDTINFNLTRYSHALIDYSAKVRTGSDYYLFCRLPGNKEDNPYQFSPGNGILEIKKGEQKNIRLELEDFHGNVSRLYLNIRAKDSKPAKSRLLDSTGAKNTIQLAGASLEWKEDSWYDQPLYDIQVRALSGTDRYSPTFSFFMQSLPAIHAPLTFHLKNYNLSNQLPEKGVIVLENYKGIKKALNTTYSGGIYSATFNEPGHLYLTVDTIPPKIQLLNYNETTNKFSGNQILCKISDDLSGIQYYRGTINDQWILMDYDAKSGTLTYNFDEKCPTGEHQFKLVVTDYKSNIQTFTKTFKN